MSRDPVQPAESLWICKDVAGFLRIGRNAVYELAANGDLPSVRVGSRLRFKPAEVRAWLDRQQGPRAAVIPLPRSTKNGGRVGDAE